MVTDADAIVAPPSHRCWHLDWLCPSGLRLHPHRLENYIYEVPPALAHSRLRVPPGPRREPSSGTPTGKDGTDRSAGGGPVAANHSPDRTVRVNRAEGLAQILIMLAIGAAAGAASFTHVHNVAASHGQPGWRAWADAIVLELMSIASGLELRRRRREHTSPRFPAVVLGCAVVLSLAAQVVEAEPSPIGWTAAAIPALGFLVMVKVALSHTGDRSPRHSTIPRSAQSPPTHPRSTAQQTPDQRSAPVRRRSRGPSAEVEDLRTVLPAARAVRDHLAVNGEPLTRGALARHLRAGGNSVSNSKASALLKTLRSEQEPPPTRQYTDSGPDRPPQSPRQRRDHDADVNPRQEGGDTS